MTSSPPSGLRPDAELAQVIAHANRSDVEKIEYIRAKEAFIIEYVAYGTVRVVRAHAVSDLTFHFLVQDGVIYHGNTLLPGVKEFVQWMKDTKKKFLFLTNNSAPTPRELQQKLARLGIHVDESHFYTSAICTAKFLSTQKPGGSVYAIGEPGLHYALYSHGFDMNEVNPDFVVVGEGSGLNYEK
ncbi:hypothetical protein GGF32_005861, partial [Allomyces javanicus]